MLENSEGDHDVVNNHVYIWCGKEILLVRMNTAAAGKTCPTHEIQFCLHFHSDDENWQEFRFFKFDDFLGDENISTIRFHKTLYYVCSRLDRKQSVPGQLNLL